MMILLLSICVGVLLNFFLIWDLIVRYWCLMYDFGLLVCYFILSVVLCIW